MAPCQDKRGQLDNHGERRGAKKIYAMKYMLRCRCCCSLPRLKITLSSYTLKVLRRKDYIFYTYNDYIATHVYL